MIKVISAGILSSIQDLGRFGYRDSGVPISGAMDAYAAQLANKLLDNEKEAAVLEMTMIGPVLQFMKPTAIAITGAGFTPTINNIEIPLNTRVWIETGDVLRFGLAAYGLRGYLSVMGGFSTEVILGSRSQYVGLTTNISLSKGNLLPIASSEKIGRITTASVKERMEHFTSKEFICYKGPEFDLLPKTIQQLLGTQLLEVSSKSNRMAYLLKGLEVASPKEIISAPVQPGTVQLTPSGQCIVLMRDAQTTGGYARVLQLSERAMHRLSQRRGGDLVQFKISDLP